MQDEELNYDIERFETTDKGFGLRATTDLTEGVLLLNKKPYAHVLAKSQRPNFCDQCLKRRESLSRCSGCKITRYCNRTCQKNAWTSHKEECKALKQAPKLPPDFVLLLARILWKLNDDNYGDDIDLVSVLDLESNYERLASEEKEILGQYLSIFPYYWGKRMLPKPVSTPKDLINLAAKVKNNSFAISDSEYHQDVGTGLYLSCNLLNHSCQPNSVVTFTNGMLSVHTTQFVAHKEEFTISYVDTFAPSDERCEELCTIYGFQCKCVKCSTKTHDDRMLQDFNRTMSASKRDAARQFIAQLDRLHKEENFEEIKELCESYIKREVLPQHNVYMNKVYVHGMDAAIQLKHYELALNWGLLAIPAHKEYLVENHPSTGLLLMKLGKLLLYLTDLKEASHLLKEALSILKYSQYEKGAVIQELIELSKQCQIELQMSNEKFEKGSKKAVTSS